MKKKLIVGIPAHNEEKTIEKILKSLLKQKTDIFLLKKIFVFSDGSTDDTEIIVRKFKNQKISFIKSKKRIGKTLVVKKIINLSKKEKADFLTIIDADLKIKNNLLLETLYKKITKNKDIIAVSGFVTPLKPENFVQKVGYFGFNFWEKMISNAGKNKLYFRSSDPLIILRLEDFSTNSIKKYSYMHDEFYYLFSKKLEKKFAFEKKAEAKFKLPKTFSDYKKQARRYISDKDLKSLKKEKVEFSTIEKLTIFLTTLKENPLAGISFLLIHAYIHLLKTFKISDEFSNKWIQIKSTK